MPTAGQQKGMNMIHARSATYPWAILVVCATAMLLASCGKEQGPGPDSVPESYGVPTSKVLLENGATIDLAMGNYDVRYKENPDGSRDPYKVVVEGVGEGWRVYQCIRTGGEWAFGRDGQVSSPWVDEQGNVISAP